MGTFKLLAKTLSNTDNTQLSLINPIWISLACSFCLSQSLSVNPLHLWPATAWSRTSPLIDALVWLKSSSDYHYRRAFWREKIAFCLSWPWQEVRKEKAVSLKTLALINEFTHQPRNSHFPFIALPMWLSLPSQAMSRLGQKGLVVKPRAKMDPVLVLWHDGFMYDLFTWVKWLLIWFIKDWIVVYFNQTKIVKFMCVSVTYWPWLPQQGTTCIIDQREEMRNPDGRGALTLKTHAHMLQGVRLSEVVLYCKVCVRSSLPL